MERYRLLAVSLAMSVGACGSPLGLDSSCAERDGIAICLAKAMYSPGEQLPFAIHNVGTRVVFENVCAGAVVGRRTPQDDWALSYGVARQCTHSDTRETVVANMRRLEPGATLEGEMHVNEFAYEGQWRLELYLVDESGEPISEEPFASRPFTVRR